VAKCGREYSFKSDVWLNVAESTASRVMCG